MDDQEKLSLRKQVEILNLQKDVLSRQLSKLRNDIVAERSQLQQKQTKLLDDIRVKDIEIRAVRNYMEKRDNDVKTQLRDEFHTLKMEKERIAEVTKELEARRNLIENLISEKQSEFEKRLQTEKALFEKSREEYLKNTKKMQAALDEHIHKGAVSAKQSEEEINNLREQLVIKDNTIAESKKTAAIYGNEKKALLKKIDNMRKQSQNSQKTADALLIAIQKNETLQKLNNSLETKISKMEAPRQKKHAKQFPKPAAVSTAKFKCSECGAIVGENDKKCPECGEKFE